MKPSFYSILLLLCFTGVRAETPVDSMPVDKETDLLCAPDKKNFGVGEKITYILYYNLGFIWLSAGEVTFEVKEYNGLIHLQTVGKTYPSYEWFYSVDNVYNSYLDPQTLLPVKTEKSISEGSYYLYEEVRYDRLNGKAFSKRKRKKNEPLNKVVSDISPCVHDLLSLVYALRSKAYSEQLNEHDVLPIELFMDHKEYGLSLNYKGDIKKMDIRNQGTFSVKHFIPSLIKAQLFEEGDVMNIYVSNDRNVVPLQIESPLSVGKVKAVLKSYEGLKFPLSSKTD